MHAHNDVAVQRRLDELAPYLQGLGNQTRKTYERGGILAAMPDASFPIADARFSRRADSITYHSRGAVYFSVTRQGELTLSGQGEEVSLTSALMPYVQPGRPQDLQGSTHEDSPTEWFPPPRLLLDTETSDLYIASVSRGIGSRTTTVFVPLEQYIAERARLFVEAFHALD